MKIDAITYGGWDGCIRLSNPQIELVASTAIGPRLIRFGRPGGPNQLREFAEESGQTGGDAFHLYGGHRFWVAPEASPRSYFPDNFPIKVDTHPEFVRLIAPVETENGLQKELDIALMGDLPAASVVHRLKNSGRWPVEMAPWAITLMALDGVAILPLPPQGSHESGDLLPAATLSLWSYTNLTDPRFTFTPQAILLRHQATSPDGSPSRPQKIGMSNQRGWEAYYRDGDLFIKRFTPLQGVTYPDQGCNAEVFTRHDMIELESLAPLTIVPPGGQVEYIERWSLASGFRDPGEGSEALKQILAAIG